MNGRTYTFFTCPRLGSGDIMHSRTYIVESDGHVIRLCKVDRSGILIRQRISRGQCAREMAYLRRNMYLGWRVA